MIVPFAQSQVLLRGETGLSRSLFPSAPPPPSSEREKEVCLVLGEERGDISGEEMGESEIQSVMSMSLSSASTSSISWSDADDEEEKKKEEEGEGEGEGEDDGEDEEEKDEDADEIGSVRAEVCRMAFL